MLPVDGGPRAIHIVTLFEVGSTLLAKLNTQLETVDGQPCHPDLILTLQTLEDVLINAEQDAPGFWDNI
jgi:hypothetical protein